MSGPVIRAFDGSYPAKRAAAISGVPLSTVYYWARTEVVVPSIAQERPMLWSYADLMGLRVVQWLRRPKTGTDTALPPSPMPEVRRALLRVQQAGLDLWSPEQIGKQASPLRVDRHGHIYVIELDSVTNAVGQGILDPDALDLLGVFEVDGGRGPDLRRPKERLRIIPGKLAGEPHIAETRIPTSNLAALHRRGFTVDSITRLYPDVSIEAVMNALELERELSAAIDAAA